MKFRAEWPCGQVDVKDGGDKIIKKREAIGDPKVSKIVFSEEPIRKLPMGHWFEIRIDDAQMGFTTIMALGFTAEDPASIEEGALPARANLLPETCLIGYQKAVWWKGDKLDLDNDPFIDILPRKLNRVGALLTPNGSLSIYVDRIKMITIDPGSEGLEKIDLERPIYAVIDMWGGARQLTVQNSLPPTEEEEAAAKAAKSTKGGGVTKKEEKEGEPATEGGGDAAPAEGEEGEAEEEAS